MVSNLPAADELADIRSRIKALRERERELRDHVLKVPEDCAGLRHEAVVRTQRRRVFLRDRLPAHILDSPEYWAERETRVVTLRDRTCHDRIGQDGPQGTGRTTSADGVGERRSPLAWGPDDFDVLEDW